MEALQIFQTLIEARNTPTVLQRQPYTDVFLTHLHHHSTVVELSGTELLEEPVLRNNTPQQEIRGLEMLEHLTKVNIARTSICRIPDDLRDSYLTCKIDACPYVFV